jgi:hypothetical protein
VEYSEKKTRQNNGEKAKDEKYEKKIRNNMKKFAKS